MSSYCDIADVYRWIPPGSVPTPGRLISEVATATEILTLDCHGLEDDDELVFRAEAGGSLPSPLVAGTTYYAIALTDSTFSVAASAGGAAINLTTEGSNVVLVRQLSWTKWIEESSSEIEDTLPAHAVPLEAPYPSIVRSYTAGLTAEKALAFSGASSARIEARLDRTRMALDRWRKGAPIRGAVVPPSANLSISASATAADPRGWANRGDGYIP